MIQSAPCATCSRTARRAPSAPSTGSTPWGSSSSQLDDTIGYIPVGAIARVDAKIRGPGISPLLMARLISTSAYIAPSVSRSRNAVKPCSSARRALRAPRMARYAID
ncbi:MAG: hypothetical protein AUH34_01345 [Gemmatimonadetes bacterium 13_1_40CM_70_12]|nr:MAG: hypothetical protein AUH34_01345 [Gemmatimonadetes bacterium 13_1_40CM_70_12]